MTKIFNRLEKRTIFTNNEIDNAIELYGLNINDLKEIVKHRLIKNYGDMTKDMLYYTLVKRERSPLENSYLKHLEYTTTSDFKMRLNHIKVLATRLSNKLTNVERSKLYEQIHDLKKEYVETKSKNIRREVIKKIVYITNNLYNTQKQHTELQHDQTYFALRDIKHLFDRNDINYQPIFVRSAMKGGFEEYEILGNRNIMTIKEYLTTIYLPLTKLIDKKQQSTKDEQKIQLKLMVVFTKVNNPLDRYFEYIDSDSNILRRGDDTTEFINKLFNSVLENYEKKANALKGSNLVFDGIDLTLVQFIKIKLKKGGSYIPTPDWISVKKVTINPKNINDDCCFAYSIVASIHNNEIDHHPDRIAKLTPFIDRHNWNDINFPTEQKDWDKFERNNKNVALNILSAHSTKKKLHIIRTSKHNNTREHKVILLMITDKNNNWHYVCVKSLKNYVEVYFLIIMVIIIV